MIGKILAHYRVLDRLGTGGMGEIYLAIDSRLGRQVALKALPPDLASDSERLQRFEREIRILARLNHPNIVTIFSVEEDKDLRFFTMEVVRGQVLSRVIRPNGVDLERFFALAIPLVEALAAAHENRVTHRDLKPSNIMVSDDDRVKVLDFGLAKARPAPSFSGASLGAARGPEEISLTEEGRILGTGPYMSPEQVMGEKLDARSDVFSLGILLTEMLTGQRPFEGRTQVDLLSAIVGREPAFAAGDDRLPRRLQSILERCLQKDPADRFESAAELGEELRQLKKDLDVHQILTETASVEVDAFAPIFARSRRGRLMWMTAFGVLLALAAAGLYLIGQLLANG